MNNWGAILILLALPIILLFGLNQMRSALVGEKVNERIVEKRTLNEVYEVKVGETIPKIEEALEETDIDSFVYLGMDKTENNKPQLLLGKRIWHYDGYSESIEVQELRAEVERHDTLLTLEGDEGYPNVYFNVIFLEEKKNKILVRIERIKVDEEYETTGLFGRMQKMQEESSK